MYYAKEMVFRAIFKLGRPKEHCLSTFQLKGGKNQNKVFSFFNSSVKKHK